MSHTKNTWESIDIWIKISITSIWEIIVYRNTDKMWSIFGFYDFEHVANKADIAKWYYRENVIMKIGPHRISISFYCYKIAVLFCFPYYVFYGTKKVLCRKECLESKPKYSNVMAIKKTINNFYCIFFSVEYHFSYDKKE